MQSVRIRVPATTANLGPGFDTFGCALARYNTVTFTRLPEGQLAFENVLPEFCQEDNLAVRSFRHAEMALGLAPTGLRVRIDADIPVSSGLGSSATMIVAGVTAAFLLGNHPYDLREILRLATQLEGHPDNVAPAIYGGLTVSTMTEDGPLSVPFPVHDSVRFLVLLPDVLVEAPVERLLLSSVERDTEDDCLDEDEPAEYAERDEDDELELEGLEYEDREDELEEVERELEEDVLALDDEDVDLEPDVCEEERELEDDERELLDCAEISSCDADNAIPISIIATANRFVFIAMMFFGSGCFNSIKVILF